jgi:RNA-directed DNA polymerase
MKVLPERFGRYGLTLHPTKTRLLYFRPRREGEPPQPDSRGFDFLGITHYWGRSKRGYWVVMRKTAASRFSRALKKIAVWMRTAIHEPIGRQHEQLLAKLRGHDNYYGIPGNGRALARFRQEVIRLWRQRLGRRRRQGVLSWVRFWRLLERYPLPPPQMRRWVDAANP